MDKWEYRTEIIIANMDNKGVGKYLSEKYPNWKPLQFSPETMQLHLDDMGGSGWELVTMQPIAGVGEKMDIYFNADSTYSHAYFCVFKRRKQE